ncbi:MAG: hypothetical protein ACE37H_09220 [Phycisphaeraceae bacterium]
MPKTYLPVKDADLLTWSQNFLDRLGADPAGYGLTVEQAAAYGTAQSAYADAFALANQSTTRTPASVQAKNTARVALVTLIRELVDICQAWPGMTNDKRAELQITVRDNTPTPVPVPEEAPNIDILSVSGYTIMLRLHNGDSTSRAKPEGVKGATLFSFVGDAPPTDLSAWKFEGNVTTTTRLAVTVPGTVAAGSKVWLTSFWFNTRAESGPATQPVSTNIQGGGLSQAA